MTSKLICIILICLCNLFTTSGQSVFLCTNTTATVNITVNVTQLPPQKLDFYILWGCNYGATKYSYKYYLKAQSRYLRPALLAVLNVSKSREPLISIGTFTTKRLGGIGWARDYVFKHHSVFTNDTQLIIKKITPDINDPNNPYMRDAEAIPITSSLEALLHIIKNSETLGFRPGSQRIVFLVTNLMFGRRGDTFPNMRNPDSTTFAIAYNDPANIINTFPENDCDKVLEDDCTLWGDICPLKNGLKQTLAGTITCNNLGLFTYGFVNRTNTTMFYEGSCEDFPTEKNTTDAVAMATPATYTLWPMIEHEDGKAISSAAVAGFTALVAQFGAGSMMINRTSNLEYVFKTYMPPNGYLLPVITHNNVSSLQQITLVNCNQVTCDIQVTFKYSDGVNETFVMNVTGVGVYNINVTNCLNGSNVTEMTQTVSSLPTSTPTSTTTSTPTITSTSTPTSTPTSIPTSTPTSIPTSTPINTPTTAPPSTLNSESNSAPISTPISTPTSVPTNTPINTPINTPTSAPTIVPTSTPTSALPNTPTTAPFSTSNSESNSVPISTPINTPTSTSTGTPANTPTSAITNPPSDTPTITQTNMITDSKTTSPVESETSPPSTTPVIGVTASTAETEKPVQTQSFITDNQTETTESQRAIFTSKPLKENQDDVKILAGVIIGVAGLLSCCFWWWLFFRIKRVRNYTHIPAG